MQYFSNFFSGRARALAVDPTNTSIVYLGIEEPSFGNEGQGAGTACKTCPELEEFMIAENLDQRSHLGS